MTEKIEASTGSRRSSRATLLLIIPAIGLLIAFLLFPYLNMIVMSFRTPSTSDVFAPGYTIANYLDIIFIWPNF